MTTSAKSRNVADRIRAEMDRLIASGMTVEQASRTIAEQNTAAYVASLAAKRNRRRYR